MNKIEVAIKLLQLINERKIINSRIIAEELKVSIRTAQRYLRELSALPCIGNNDNNRDYELYPDYKIKEAVLNSNFCEIILNKFNKNFKSATANELYCLVCGYTKGKILHSLLIFDDNHEENKLKINQLASTIKAMHK
jgi:hypothetical protein